MIQSSVTISLVSEARGGPFVFNDLTAGCRSAAELGFDAIEIFPRSAGDLDPEVIRRLLQEHGLKLAAMGTGAGWALRGWTLIDSDPEVRRRAGEFIAEIVDCASEFGASAIIGSMQGKVDASSAREDALARLRDGLGELAGRAAKRGTSLFYEPLNRYETNVANRLEEGLELIEATGAPNLALLADLFHMNIEETSVAGALTTAMPRIGHVHWVDSNRQAAGRGHMDFQPIADALRSGGYSGFLSAEALPLPNPTEAARQTMETFKRFFGRED